MPRRVSGFATSGRRGPGLGLKYPNDVLVSGPVDYTVPVREFYGEVEGETILVTGGASGIGQACCHALAMLGAHVAVADMNQQKGLETVAEIKADVKRQGGTGSARFFQCDVSSYQSQARMFEDVLYWSPAGERVLNSVIVNAGIQETCSIMEDADAAPDPHQAPSEPNLATFKVNYIGALYSIRLAHHFLRHSPRNGPSSDRHILIMGSFASFLSSPLVPLYSSSKHGLLGLFGSLRVTTSPHHQVRINMVSPYFVATAIMPAVAKMLLAGQQMIDMRQVTDCVVRMIGDKRIMGRMVALGPGMEEDVDIGGGLEEVETFSRRAVKAINLKYNGKIFFMRWGRIGWDIFLLLAGLFWATMMVKLRTWFMGNR